MTFFSTVIPWESAMIIATRNAINARLPSQTVGFAKA